jgi:hypothetical protein
VSHGGIKIVQNLFDKGTRLETGPVINNDHNNITAHFNNNSNCHNDKFTLHEGYLGFYQFCGLEL